jgi:hypothetical protein
VTKPVEKSPAIPKKNYFEQVDFSKIEKRLIFFECLIFGTMMYPMSD